MDWGAALEWIFLAGLLIWAGGFCFGEIVKEKNDDLYVIAQVIAAVGKVILLFIFLGVIFYIFKKMVRVSFLTNRGKMAPRTAAIIKALACAAGHLFTSPGEARRRA